MRRIVINDYKLTDEDVEDEVVRVKGLIINSRGKILLAHNNYTYQFPGGHIEKEEPMDQCIIREIKEETGIDVKVEEKPFLVITVYYDSYFGTSKKVKSSVYYYRIFTDDVPNYNETHYDELELETEFNLFYVNLVGLDNFLEKSIENGSIDSDIGREMLLVCDVYREMFGGI